jgi:hypothetical protein
MYSAALNFSALLLGTLRSFSLVRLRSSCVFYDGLAVIPPTNTHALVR